MKHKKTWLVIAIILLCVVIALLALSAYQLIYQYAPLSYWASDDLNHTFLSEYSRAEYEELCKKLDAGEINAIHFSLDIRLPSFPLSRDAFSDASAYQEALEEFQTPYYEELIQKYPLGLIAQCNGVSDHSSLDTPEEIAACNGVHVRFDPKHVDLDYDIYQSVSIEDFMKEIDTISRGCEDEIFVYEPNITISVGGHTIDATANGSSGRYSMAQAKADMGITNTPYTGQGIKVGVIEVNLSSEHSKDVQAIIRSIAPDVTIDTRSASTLDKLIEAINDLSNCDIVNISLRYEINGLHNGAVGSLYIDYYSNLNETLYFVAAGNTDQIATDNDNVFYPAFAPNVMSVGSMNVDKELSYFSLYGDLMSVSSDGENDYITISLKPEIVAPGENIVGLRDFPGTSENISGSYSFGGISGTSFSSPMACAVAALLLEEFPDLRADAAALKAIMMASAEQLDGHSDTNIDFDNKTGAGCIQYDIAREIARNHQYCSGEYECMNPANPYYDLPTPVVELAPNETLRVVLAQLEPGYEGFNLGAINTAWALSQYSVTLMNHETNQQLLRQNITKNVGQVTYKNNTSVTQKIRIEVEAEANGGLLQMLYTTPPEHTPYYKVTIAYNATPVHNFTEWTEWGTHPEYHTRSCYVCGFFSTQTHTPASTWTQGDSTDHFKRCTKCQYICNRQAHTPSSSWSQGTNYHYKTCTVCNQSVEETPHTYVRGVCAVCGKRGGGNNEIMKEPDQPELN